MTKDHMEKPLFPSADEQERHLKAAKQLRGEFLLDLAVYCQQEICRLVSKASDTRNVTAVALCAVAIFWLAILDSPKVTEADQSTISQDQASGLK